ncbi:unnamed protein product [Rotaria sp. Silwood2]|nr:unnamed protein product [Rotaria sp. Silwood2]CAF3078475.1 unnamed protein product [Rotaria sp. Silwood2]CAF3370342.1 unnamed protein product [Rotaria sp. Silwood2]CAF4122735.1 unnamed protein product [Rotaria sp. Silwood2]CAF4178030.1 unnamed protein product [Rotaria sp. Silwood2]
MYHRYYHLNCKKNRTTTRPDYDPDELPYPIPHICQSDLTNIEFSLRRSPLKCGLHAIQKFLPDKPVPQYIDSAVSVLRALIANLTKIRHIIGPALRRYSNLEKSFNISDYRVQAHKKYGQWESIAKALLAGYCDNVFVSVRELQEKNLRFARYKDTEDIAVLDIKSTLTRPIKQEPVPLVVARDVFYSTAVRSRIIISFVGGIKLDWMNHSIKREFSLTVKEETYLNNNNKYDRVR